MNWSLCLLRKPLSMIFFRESLEAVGNALQFKGWRFESWKDVRSWILFKILRLLSLPQYCDNFSTSMPLGAKQFNRYSIAFWALRHWSNWDIKLLKRFGCCGNWTHDLLVLWLCKHRNVSVSDSYSLDLVSIWKGKLALAAEFSSWL